MGSCGMAFVKYLVYFFNFLFAVSGLILLSVGAVILARYYHYYNFVGETFWSAPIALIVVGAIVILIAFVGCCGAAKESSWMTLTFSVLLAFIFLTELGVGIAGYVKHSELRETLDDQFNSTLMSFTNSSDSKLAWKKIQTELKCCGVNGPEDWKPLYRNDTVPASCCEPGRETCTRLSARPEGCKEKLYGLLDESALLLGFVGLGIAGVQLLGVCLGCCLSRGFKENYEAV